MIQSKPFASNFNLGSPPSSASMSSVPLLSSLSIGGSKPSQDQQQQQQQQQQPPQSHPSQQQQHLPQQQFGLNPYQLNGMVTSSNPSIRIINPSSIPKSWTIRPSLVRRFSLQTLFDSHLKVALIAFLSP